MSKDSSKLPDIQQTAWQLSCIQLSGWISLPVLATSIYILQVNSFLGAVLTIVVGNALVWFVRFGIVAMSFEKRQSVLDISKEYLGFIGNYSVAILLLVSTFSWFIVQTTSGSSSITKLLTINEDPNIDQFMQVSVFLGIASTLFCMGGIKVLKQLSVVALPILVILFLVILYLIPEMSAYKNQGNLSLAGLGLVLSTNLGFTADLPTFFRHSKSFETSVKALIIVQVFSLFLGILSLFLGSIFIGDFELTHKFVTSGEYSVLRALIVGFIFLSVVCANVANVYSASVGWELVAPKSLIGKKEYLILGLVLTTVFILITGFFSPDFLLKISDGSLVNLSIVLLAGYIIAVREKRAPSRSEQSTYFLAWSLSTLVNVLQFWGIVFSEYSPMLVAGSIIAATLFLGFFSSRFFYSR